MMIFLLRNLYTSWKFVLHLQRNIDLLDKEDCVKKSSIDKIKRQKDNKRERDGVRYEKKNI